MAANTKIEWAHHTVNFWWGCAKVSAGCAHCYAERIARVCSRGRATWGHDGLRMNRVPAALRELAEIDAGAERRGRRERVFINSMSDVFEDRRDLDWARASLFQLAPGLGNLDILLLTKRPENIRRLVPAAWFLPGCWPRNVWLGVTAEDQENADRRLPILLGIPDAIRFVSCEPLLGPIDLRIAAFNGSDSFHALAGIDWVICGGESSPSARPMSREWAYWLRDQCQAAGVPFFFKQWGEWAPTTPPIRLGAKLTGRLLDGREWGEVPL